MNAVSRVGVWFGYFLLMKHDAVKKIGIIVILDGDCRFVGWRCFDGCNLLRMENGEGEGGFGRVELIAQLRARQLEHSIEIVRRFAVDVNERSQNPQIVLDGVVANHLHSILVDVGLDVELSRCLLLGAVERDFLVVGVQVGKNVDAARVEVLELRLNIVVGVNGDVDVLEELDSALDVRIRHEIVLIAGNYDLRLQFTAAQIL